MERATYSQVQELVRQLPATKLLIAYSLLLELVDKKVDTLSPQLEFMQHPTHKRHQLLTQQAAQMVAHYNSCSSCSSCRVYRCASYTKKNNKIVVKIGMVHDAIAYAPYK